MSSRLVHLEATKNPDGPIARRRTRFKPSDFPFECILADETDIHSFFHPIQSGCEVSLKVDIDSTSGHIDSIHTPHTAAIFLVSFRLDEVDTTLMAQMQAVYYRDQAGIEPVHDFLKGLPPEVRAALDLQIDRLNMLADTDPPLPFPHSSQVDGELRELRCHYGRTLFRVLYRRSRSLFVMLHILQKNSRRLPEPDIEIGRERWADFEGRMNEIPRRRPRAAGRDAP